jgi:hypothetical protein
LPDAVVCAGLPVVSGERVLIMLEDAKMNEFEIAAVVCGFLMIGVLILAEIFNLFGVQ